LLRDLFDHQACADASVIGAIRRHDAASRDLELRTKLHHILVTHRFWTRLSQGLPFVVEDESKVPDSLDPLVRQFQQTYDEVRPWLAQLQDAELTRMLESPFFEGRKYSVRDGLMQVCLHSQGHRAQCASRLRLLGG